MLRYGSFFTDMVAGFVFVMSIGLLIVSPLPVRRHSAVIINTDSKDNVTLAAAEQE